MQFPIPTVVRSCPVCGPQEPSRLYVSERIDHAKLNEFAFASRKLPEYMHLRLHECLGCGVVFASPAFEPGALATAYRDAAFDSSEAAGCAARTYGRLAQSISATLPSHDGVLDVGAGDGAFLAQVMAAGFSNVVGVEPSRAPIQAASLAVRPFLRQEMFSPERFNPESFSLVTCFQTIEHLYDPLGFCREASKLLRPGGALMLVGHNHRAFSARLLGKRSPIFDLEHLQLFCPRSFRRLLAAAGLERILIRSVWNRYPLAYWTRLFPWPAGTKQRLTGFLENFRIGRMQVALPAGNLAAVAFKCQR